MVVVVSAGTLMLAISSLSRNARYVGAMWIGALAGRQRGLERADQDTIASRLVPALSYTDDLSRVREALLDSPTRPGRRSGLSSAGLANQTRRRGARFGPGARRRRPASFAPRPRPPPPACPTRRRATARISGWRFQHCRYPWPWSAGVLAGAGCRVSVVILSTGVRSLSIAPMSMGKADHERVRSPRRSSFAGLEVVRPGDRA